MNQVEICTPRKYKLREIWGTAQADSNCVSIKFSSYDEAIANLVVWERSLQHLAAMFKFEALLILVPGQNSMLIRPRLIPSVKIDFLPMPPHGEEERIKYLVTDRRQLPGELVDVLAEIKNSSNVAVIVDWQEQRQIVMNAACNKIPIGASLDECINWTRHDYWVPADLASLEQKCRQDGGTVEHSALTLDPTLKRLHPTQPERWDWIQIRSQFRMVDCGDFGLYQIARNLEYRTAIAPTGIA